MRQTSKVKWRFVQLCGFLRFTAGLVTFLTLLVCIAIGDKTTVSICPPIKKIKVRDTDIFLFYILFEPRIYLFVDFFIFQFLFYTLWNTNLQGRNIFRPFISVFLKMTYVIFNFRNSYCDYSRINSNGGLHMIYHARFLCIWSQVSSPVRIHCERDGSEPSLLYIAGPVTIQWIN